MSQVYFVFVLYLYFLPLLFVVATLAAQVEAEVSLCLRLSRLILTLISVLLTALAAAEFPVPPVLLQAEAAIAEAEVVAECVVASVESSVPPVPSLEARPVRQLSPTVCPSCL